MFILILVISVVLAWVGNEMRFAAVIRSHMRTLQFAKSELERVEQELARLRQGKRQDRTRAFWETDLEGTNLKGMTLKIPSNSFQKASFRNCDLKGATLEGAGAAFQLSRFDGAQLAGATLTGGGAAFQGSSFVGADLTGAILTGGSVSFQSATFASANLEGAKLSGSFQAATIDSARFEGADLSGIASQDLASCIFGTPPTYDGKTIFPDGFDPVANMWRKVE
jgi:uncharacterized protein YjbI with pentapeptide repeats